MATDDVDINSFRTDMESAQTIRQWSLRTAIPHKMIRQAVQAGEIQAFRFTQRGQIYITTSAMTKFIAESMIRARTTTTSDDD